MRIGSGKTGARLNMTEAMSRREIEDILTSIRKLVSHDPALAAEQSARAHQDSAPMGKLVLTSALRVADPVEPTAPAPDVPTNGVSDTDDSWPTEDMLNEHTSALVIPAVTEPVAPDSVTEQETSASLLARITRSAATIAPATAQPSQPAETEAAPIAPHVAVNIDAAPENLGVRPDDVQDWLDDADIPLPDYNASEDVISAATQDQGSDAPDSSLEETLARLEAMLSEQSVAHDTSTTQAAPSVADPAPERPLTDGDTDDTAMIDEAMLYQLVANIVRQELQGELGEKITRAIRKLVRSEVARELQLRNL
jgi:hypothetical protein